MRITDIETIMLRLPEVRPNGDGLQDLLVIRVHTDEGLVGIGEVHTAPLVARAVIDAPISQLTVQGFRQLLIGRDPRRINELWHLMYDHSTTFGRRGIVVNVISGIDIALWDLLGKSLGVPIHQLLGGAVRDTMPTYASDLTPDTLEEIVDLAVRHQGSGFAAMKFGWGGLGRDVREDARWIAAVRDAVGPDVALMLDMGEPAPFDQALWLARALADSDVAFLEEPLSPDDLDGFRDLVAISPTPIATGEKETTRFGFRDLMERGGLRIIQPDMARVGGVTEMLRIAALAEVRDVRVIPHCWASDILVSVTCQFLATRQDAPYLEFNVMDNPLRTQLLVEPIRPIDGRVRVPDGPGLGIELNPETLDRYRWEP
jgi:L-alanine-DL-glutamate epimerase-like enolase superfamily enzyme